MSCRIRVPSPGVWVLVAASGALLSAGLARARSEEPWKLATPAPAVALRPERVPDADKIACAECHAAVVEEWAVTAHALAWIDVEYQEQLADRKRPETCHDCHIPKPLMLAEKVGAKPDARESLLDHGISCESCHLGAGGAMLGPRGAGSSAHPSLASPVFAGAGANALCSSCHRTSIGPVVGLAKDFEQSKQAERGRSCLGCHAAEVELQFTKEGAATTASAPVPGKRKGRSHALQTPRDPTFLRRAFVLRLDASAGKVRLFVRNAAGHRVPGLIGRKLEFAIEALDAGGASLGKETLTIDATKYLPVDGELATVLKPETASVRVVGTHDEPRATAPVVFLEETLKR